MGCIHPDIPPAEIDGVVAAEVFVVEIVVGGSVEPAAEAILGEPFREHFVTEVTGDVEDGHPKEKGEQGERVDGKGEREDEKNSCFDDGFERVE